MTLNLSMTVGNPMRADNNVYGYYKEKKFKGQNKVQRNSKYEKFKKIQERKFGKQMKVRVSWTYRDVRNTISE